MFNRKPCSREGLAVERVRSDARLYRALDRLLAMARRSLDAVKLDVAAVMAKAREELHQHSNINGYILKDSAAGIFLRLLKGETP